MTRITPSERFRRELDDALAGVDGEQDPVETVARLGARLILQQALEAETEVFLGRSRYERSAEPVGYRNGYEPRTVRTTSGPLELERPRLRGASELGFASAVLGKQVTRTHALEALVVLSFLRGLSVRDVEGLLEEVFDGKVVSKSTVSRICEQTKERYRSWRERDLAEHDLVYCFLDAIYLKLRPDDEPAEGVLCAWGMTLEGRKVLLGLQLGSRESYEDWLDFARELTKRGLRCPALIVADGAPGLWKAASEAWPAALGQRCTVHKLRNLLAKLPERLHREVKGRYWVALDEAQSPTAAGTALRGLARDYGAAHPSFARSLEDDLDALVVHLRFPGEHRKRIRSTNLLERTFVEVRRRTKVIGRFPGETSALCLVWAVLELASRGWRGITMTPKAVAEIERLRRALAAGEPLPEPTVDEEVIAA
ncbi:MAG: IS256 family transposase [Thermoleophilaceae bacterium]